MLTGKDYPHLCPACRATLDRVAEMLTIAGEDNDDEEAACMYAGDHALFCGEGGRECGETT